LQDWERASRDRWSLRAEVWTLRYRTPAPHWQHRQLPGWRSANGSSIRQRASWPRWRTVTSPTSLRTGTARSVRTSAGSHGPGLFDRGRFSCSSCRSATVNRRQASWVRPWGAQRGGPSLRVDLVGCGIDHVRRGPHAPLDRGATDGRGHEDVEGLARAALPFGLAVRGDLIRQAWARPRCLRRRSS